MKALNRQSQFWSSPALALLVLLVALPRNALAEFSLGDSWNFPLDTRGADSLAGGVNQSDSLDFILDTTGLDLAAEGILQSDSRDFILDTTFADAGSGFRLSDSADFILDTRPSDTGLGVLLSDSADFVLDTTSPDVGVGFLLADSGDFSVDTRGADTGPSGLLLADSLDFTLNTRDITLELSPTILSPVCLQGTDASSDSIAVWNSGAGTMSYTVSETNSWLSCSLTSGVSTGETNLITIAYSTGGLMPGTHNATITVTAAGAAGSPQDVAVALTVDALEGPLAWWRFEDGTYGTDVMHANAVGVFSPDVPDSSGNGNHLSVWSTGGDAGYGYRSDVATGQIPLTSAANNFSVQNTGGYPCMFTSSNDFIHTITPLAWTIEVAFQPEGTGTHRTLVGRDSMGTLAGDTNLAALYLKITPSDELAIVFCDVSGYLHMAISASELVHGFTFPYASTGQWQTAVATCDGDTLRLYHRNIEAGDSAFTLVAETDLTVSGSPDRRLTAGSGSGSDWTHGTWSVGRGLYAGGHTDRAWGFIDEVRISQGALVPEEFLFYDANVNLPPIVLNSNDSGPGSLRQVVGSAGNGDTVTFTNTLSGHAILLTSGQIQVTNSLTIDASSLPAGVIIDGNTNSRIFEFATGTTNTLAGLTLTNGNTSGNGGAISLKANAALTLTHSTLSGNSANAGGGIHNYNGMLTVNNSTLGGNSAIYGGGIYNYGTLITVNNCTLSGNSALEAGGIWNSGTLTINNCTLSGNSATNYGGGIINYGTNTLNNTVVAGNTAAAAANIHGSFSGTNNVIDGAPTLAPLGDYGGPTQTMPPLPGSPAIDAGLDTGSLPAADQRGFARVVGATVDIGAVEFQGASDVTLFWFTDWDGDGSPFGVELALGNNPLVADPDAPGYPVPYPPDTGNGIAFGFNHAATNYTAWVVKRSLDLSLPDSFVEIYRYDGPTGIITVTNDLMVNLTGDSIEITDELMPQPPAAFYQVTIEPSP